jgi:hypothetical protein
MDLSDGDVADGRCPKQKKAAAGAFRAMMLACEAA